MTLGVWIESDVTLQDGSTKEKVGPRKEKTSMEKQSKKTGIKTYLVNGLIGVRVRPRGRPTKGKTKRGVG